MRIFQRILVLVFLVASINDSTAQGTLPIYADYLSDNVYLVHPAAAGIGTCGKARFTARQQWAGIPNAPEIQTLSFHTKFSENSNTGLGFVIFNDKNGFHSQKGFQGTYAYHIPMSSDKIFKQLSFGISYTAVQNQSDQRAFTDPTVAQLVESAGYFNADVGLAYHYGGFSSYFTVKNLLLSAKDDFTNNSEPLNLKNYILSLGYYFGEDKYVQLEPSFMVQYKERTGETIADFNIKAYKTFRTTRIWAALSYRQSFDATPVENSKFLTPIIGVNFNRFMFSYAYTKQLNDIVLTNSGFHQVSVGFDLFCRQPRAASCPNINSSFSHSN